MDLAGETATAAQRRNSLCVRDDVGSVRGNGDRVASTGGRVDANRAAVRPDRAGIHTDGGRGGPQGAAIGPDGAAIDPDGRCVGPDARGVGPNVRVVGPNVRRVRSDGPCVVAERVGVLIDLVDQVRRDLARPYNCHLEGRQSSPRTCPSRLGAHDREQVGGRVVAECIRQHRDGFLEARHIASDRHRTTNDHKRDERQRHVGCLTSQIEAADPQRVLPGGFDTERRRLGDN